MRKITKSDLQSPNRFKEILLDKLVEWKEKIKKEGGIEFEIEEVGELLLSACRSNDFNVLISQANKIFLNEERAWEWFSNKIIPYTVAVRLDDEDVLRLLIFSLEMTYQMFSGGTRATVSAKGFRERRRTFEAILVDQFTGKCGEIIFKKFLEQNFPFLKVELDWGISRQIEKYRNDIINATKMVSIKSSPALAGIWAEADVGYDYGVMVKCCVPQPTILQFFIEVCGFTKLLDFVETRIPQQDAIFANYIAQIKERIRNYKCDTIRTSLKGIVCGYFKTADDFLVREGQIREYLGKVRETRYMISIKDLKWEMDDWRTFINDVGLV